MKIKSLAARQILDSRGEWTVEATLEFKNGTRATASVPQGKSTGAAEAMTLPADVAVRKINNVIAPALKRGEFHSEELFDSFLVKLDGTAQKSRLGANAILATSIAFTRASAIANKVPLWQHIRKICGSPVKSSREVTHPRLFINMVNGGLHAGNNLNFQEYLVIPKTRTFKEAAEIGAKIYNELGNTLARTKGKNARNLGDEGGYAPNFKTDEDPLRDLRLVVNKLKLSKKVDFGIDAAATDIKKLDHKKLAKLYSKLVHQKDFIYLEDPFKEDDFLSFAALTMRFGGKAWIAGDDLTTTNVKRMERAHAEGSLNAVIVKPNQIGTVTEALDAVRAARKYNWAVIASHRSGETNDDFIADFAYGVGAEGLKLGAPARGERTAKYNRLLELEKEI